MGSPKEYGTSILVAVNGLMCKCDGKKLFFLAGNDTILMAVDVWI
jgi:hypothetical protein